MAARTSWEGYLRLSLISVPVKAYNASVPGGGDIHFHQIHKGCGSRVKYQKVCPIHGEVTKNEIVSGYEYEKGGYVIIKPEELSKLRTESDKTINIDAFIEPKELDPLYYSGRTYYLVPDGPPGQRPYGVLQQVMAEHDRYAVARVIFGGHEETVLIRPLGRLLVMTMLSYEHQIKKPSAFEDEVLRINNVPEELKLATDLVEARTEEDFDFSQYKDLYTERLTALIEAKAQGKEIVAAKKEEEPVVINLTQALRESLNKVKQGTKKRAEPLHRAAARHTKKPRSSKRKKTG